MAIADGQSPPIRQWCGAGGYDPFKKRQVPSCTRRRTPTHVGYLRLEMEAQHTEASP